MDYEALSKSKTEQLIVKVTLKCLIDILKTMESPQLCPSLFIQTN